MFSIDPLSSFSSQLLCDFPVTNGLLFHSWEGLTLPVTSNYIVCIFSKYSYAKCNVGLLTQNVMTSVRMYCSRTCKRNNVKVNDVLLNTHRMPYAGG